MFAVYVSILSCHTKSLSVYIGVNLSRALGLGEIFIVQPMASEVSAPTLPTCLFCLASVSCLELCQLVRRLVLLAQLHVQDTPFAIIALHTFPDPDGILPFSIVVQSLHSQSCMTSHQCLEANASLPPGIWLY